MLRCPEESEEDFNIVLFFGDICALAVRGGVGQFLGELLNDSPSQFLRPNCFSPLGSGEDPRVDEKMIGLGHAIQGIDFSWQGREFVRAAGTKNRLDGWACGRCGLATSRSSSLVDRQDSIARSDDGLERRRTELSLNES